LSSLTPGAQVWVAVRFNGVPVRIKGEFVGQQADLGVVKSNRTGQQYQVPARLIFAHKPEASVLNAVE